MNEKIIMPTIEDNFFYKYDIPDKFFEIIKQINKELNQKNLRDVEYLITKISTSVLINREINNNNVEEIINELDQILTQYSETYNGILQRCYRQNSNVFLLIHDYLELLIRKITEMMQQKQDDFDSYQKIISGDNKEKNKLEKEKGTFDEDDIKNTIGILNEAIRVYLNTYKDRTIIASFNSGKTIQFKIKEMELAHLLGVEIKKIIKNEKLVDALHINKEDIEGYFNRNKEDAAINILLKIIDISNGNLMEYEEQAKKDRIKQLTEKKKYTIVKHPYDEKNNESLSYKKIQVKSKSFIDYKPLDQISLILDMKEGYNIIKSNNNEVQHDILVVNNNLSKKFGYTSLVTNYTKIDNRRFFMTSMVKSKDDINEWIKNGEPAISISKEIYSVPDDGSGSVIGSVFTYGQQITFLEKVYRDFDSLSRIISLEKIINDEPKKHK